MPQHAPHTHVVREQARPGGSPATTGVRSDPAGVRSDPAPYPLPAGWGHWSRDPYPWGGSAPWRQNEGAGAGTLSSASVTRGPPPHRFRTKANALKLRTRWKRGGRSFFAPSVRQRNLRADLADNTSVISAPSCPTSRLHCAALRGPHR